MDDVGCKSRFIVIDGNEKLFRLICNAKKDKISDKGIITHYQNICIRNPMRGNRYGKASTFCELHQNGNIEDNPIVQLDLRPITRSYSKLIPFTITSNEGCKKDENIDRFHTRTAGMIYIFRPCGIRINHCEMYTSESLSQILMSIIDCFGDCPADSLLRGIVYDRSCDLHPFINNLVKNGNEIAQHYAGLKFIVDIFHVEKHTQLKCTIGHPDCKYHPHLPQFKFLENMNMEVAEQSFAKLNPHKYSTRKMCYAKRLLYLKFLDHTINEQTMKRKLK